MQSQLKFFCGNSNLPLAKQICSKLDVPVGKALVGRFSDGEVRVEIHENVRGMDVFVFQSTCPPVNENLIELLIMIDALKRASPLRLSAVIPYYCYSRQDSKERPRAPLAARMVADLLTVAGVDRVVTVDLHAEQIQGFFKIPLDHLYGTSVLMEDLRQQMRGEEVIVAPDAGGVDRARTFASHLKADLAVMDRRHQDREQESRIVGNVRGRRVVILDDMVDSARTLLRTVEIAGGAGASSVDAYCIHAVLSGDAVERIDASPLRSLTVSDTIPLSSRAMVSPKIRIVSVASLLAETVKRIHFSESVSSLFVLR